MAGMTWLLMIASILALGEAGHETFSGSLNGPELVLRVDGSDVVCRGRLAAGHGHLVCSDRREGSFTYYRDDTGGSGYGYLDGKPLVLTFG